MELKQYLKMQQQLVMTPQLQQAIKLLQLSRPELLETIQDEMVENPVLEEGTAELAKAGEANATLNGSESSPAEQIAEQTENEKARDATDSEWESFVENYNQYSYSPGSGGVRYNDDDLPSLEQTLSTSESLEEHLSWQLHMTQLTDAEAELGERIIGNIDTNGRFNGELLPELAEEVGLDVEDAEAVLEVMQQFDPVGVAARDLRECLLVQVRHFHPEEDVAEAVIDRHLEHIEKRNVPAILKDLDIDKEDLREAMDVISHLEPKPGRSYAPEATHYITPDVYVVKVGEDYVVQLNEDGMPKLRISNFYESQIKKGGADEKTREFIQDKFRSAVWLIRSIHQRQNTIRRVTESIVKFQREFLDKGVEYLRPLILRDVADDIGMHESTISRVTTNKYVHTPQGIFELKYFFNSRISTNRGPDLASESVKQRIRKIIGEEDPNKPLSDQKICKMLSEEGLRIARRTVAKYREMMNIPPSSKRKELF
ncbi:MAG: RNA polymerase factor sigma-54 [Myxococcota bacterium]